MTNIATSPRLLEGRPQRIVSTQSLDAGGLVQVSHFSVLPDIGAVVAAASVLASMVPLLVIVWRHPDPARFACFATLASLNRCASCYALDGHCTMRSSTVQLSG